MKCWRSGIVLNLQGKKALLFDCDGTLADTMPAHNKAYEMAFHLNDVPFNLKEHEKWAPLGGDILMKETVIKKGFKNKVDSIIKDKQKLLPICLEKFMVPNSELIKLIKNTDITVGVVSNGRRQSIRQILESLGILYHVSLIVTKEDYDFAKPSPQPYLIAMKKLSVRPDEVMVFEDNSFGYEAALRADIKDIVMVAI